jgi:hypothetical protein
MGLEPLGYALWEVIRVRLDVKNTALRTRAMSKVAWHCLFCSVAKVEAIAARRTKEVDKNLAMATLR